MWGQISFSYLHNLYQARTIVQAKLGFGVSEQKHSLPKEALLTILIAASINSDWTKLPGFAIQRFSLVSSIAEVWTDRLWRHL